MVQGQESVARIEGERVVVFAMVQTLTNPETLAQLPSDFFDYIVVDEVRLLEAIDRGWLIPSQRRVQEVMWVGVTPGAAPLTGHPRASRFAGLWPPLARRLPSAPLQSLTRERGQIGKQLSDLLYSIRWRKGLAVAPERFFRCRNYGATRR